MIFKFIVALLVTKTPREAKGSKNSPTRKLRTGSVWISNLIL